MPRPVWCFLAVVTIGAFLADPAAGNACAVTATEIAQPPDDANADPFPRGPWYISKDRTIWAGWSAAAMTVGRNKVLWIKPHGAEIEVSARRIDADAGEFHASVPCCYPTGFQASGLHFSHPGCWQITASAGGESLTFTTLVAERVAETE